MTHKERKRILKSIEVLNSTLNEPLSILVVREYFVQLSQICTEQEKIIQSLQDRLFNIEKNTNALSLSEELILGHLKNNITLAVEAMNKTMSIKNED